MNAIIVGQEVRLNGALLISQKDLVTVLLSIPFFTCHQSFLAAAKASYAGLPDTLVKQWFDVRLTLMTEALDVERDPGPSPQSSRVLSPPPTTLPKASASPDIPLEDAPLLSLDDNREVPSDDTVTRSPSDSQAFLSKPSAMSLPIPRLSLYPTISLRTFCPLLVFPRNLSQLFVQIHSSCSAGAQSSFPQSLVRSDVRKEGWDFLGELDGPSRAICLISSTSMRSRPLEGNSPYNPIPTPTPCARISDT